MARIMYLVVSTGFDMQQVSELSIGDPIEAVFFACAFSKDAKHGHHHTYLFQNLVLFPIQRTPCDRLMTIAGTGKSIAAHRNSHHNKVGGFQHNFSHSTT